MPEITLMSSRFMLQEQRLYRDLVMALTLPPIPFIKMEGCGNDFIFMQRRDVAMLTSAQIQYYCDRHYGIGADQLILWEAGRKAHHADISIYNADGSSAQMCVNALRCLYRLLEKTSPHSWKVTIGDCHVEVWGDGDDCAVQLPPVQKQPDSMQPGEMNPLIALTQAHYSGEYRIGNSHRIYRIPSRLPDDIQGRMAGFIPHDYNYSFVHSVTGTSAELYVVERGVGPTLSCGSAACAVGFTLYQEHRHQREWHIIQKGGTLVVTILDDAVHIKGPARSVFAGTIHEAPDE